MKDNLKEILNTMDIPIERKEDFRWLKRNIAIRNSNNPHIQDALNMLDGAIKYGLCKCGKVGSKPFPCPYGQELFNDNTECNCCPDCSSTCANDI